MPPLPRALQSPSGHLDISAARPDRFAPQGRTRPYPRAERQRSAWGVGDAVAAYIHLRQAPQGRTSPYPRAERQRSAWGVGRGDVPHGKGAHQVVHPLIWMDLAGMAPGIMSG